MFSQSYIIYIIISVLCFVPAIVLHEVAHGFAAHKLGDPTAKSQGRLSLNPLKHIDPFGTVLMPLLLMAMGGPVFGFGGGRHHCIGHFVARMDMSEALKLLARRG